MVVAEQNPHREFLRNLFKKLAHIEVNYGCGNRQCRICMMNAPRSRYSMPFETIQTIHSLRPNLTYPISHFYRNEALYYQDGEHTYADVLEDALQQGWQIIVRTHGCLPTDIVPNRAIDGMLALAQSMPLFQAFVDVQFSFDNYGWAGIDDATHFAAAQLCLQRLLPLQPTICAFFNPNDEDGPYSYRRTMEAATKLAPAYVRKVPIVPEVIFATGRARSVHPRPPTDHFGEPWDGIAILHDGTMLRKAWHEISIKPLGSIYDYGITRRD